VRTASRNKESGKQDCRNDIESQRLDDDHEFPILWKRVFQSSIAPTLTTGDVAAYCCVQFFASAFAIRRRPKAFYQSAFEHFRTDVSYTDLFPSQGKYVRPLDVVGRTPCQLSMYMWHAMFGADLKMDRRQYDRDLPLFLKMTNLEREIYDEAGGGGVPMVILQNMEGQSNPKNKLTYWDSQVHNW